MSDSVELRLYNLEQRVRNLEAKIARLRPPKNVSAGKVEESDFAFECGDLDCDSHGHSKSQLGTMLPCWQKHHDTADAYRAATRVKPRPKKSFKPR
jgi:hypothetical protein